MLRIIDRPGWSFFVALVLLLSASVVSAQNTSFTYQGRLSDSGIAANGNYDLQFALFDSLASGAQVGSTQTISSVSVNGGIFTVSLDFGAGAFPGANRWLQISARLSGTQTFTTLSPRQQISSTPYAVRSLVASSADTVSSGGTLSANVVNATTQYNQDGNRILAAVGDENLFAGIDAGAQNTSGGSNSFFGFGAGKQNTTGGSNSFFGWASGFQNKSGSGNSFFGLAAGGDNTVGQLNSFFGMAVGNDNTTGSSNSFFGAFAGVTNTVGSSNSMFGDGTGTLNLAGSRITLIGSQANVGSDNLVNATAVGANAVVNQDNSLILGSVAGVGGGTTTVNVGIGTTKPLATLDTRGNSLVSGNLGIGTTTPQVPLHVKGDALVETIGSGGNIQLGTPNGETGLSVVKPATSRADLRFDGNTLKLVAAVNNTPPAATNGLAISTAGNVGIGTTTPRAKLNVFGSSWFQGDSTPLPPEAGKGIVMGFAGEQGYISSFDYVSNEGRNLLLNNSGGNVGIGTNTPTALLHVNGGGLFTTTNNREVSIGNPNGESGIGIRNSTNRADVRFDAAALRLVAGGGTGPPPATSGITITTSGNVGVGQTGPLAKLDVAGTLKVDSLATGGDQGLCRNSVFNTIATCSSSLRYKKQIAPYRRGLDLINRLHPIAFTWKTSGSRDLGLGAEDVATVDPLLVTHNDKGEIEGVRYDRLNVVLINAIKQQQDQIEQLRAQNAALSVRLQSVERSIRKRAHGQRK